MALTTSSDLTSAVGDWLLRTDLTAVIPDFVTLAEARMNRDSRLRRLVRTDFTVDAETETTSVLTDFQEIESLYLDGDNSRYAEIDIVSPGALHEFQRRYGPTGMPRAAAVVDGTLVFAPVPDQTYSFVLSYYQGFTALTTTDSTNWVLTSHPDVYLYGSLTEAAPYMKDDQRIPIWSQRYDTALEEIHQAQQREQYSGNLRRRVLNPIP